MHAVARRRWATGCWVFILCLGGSQAETFRVANYNLEGYLDTPTETRPVKTVESKRKIRETICAMRPDVIALQEMGTTNALLELRDALKVDGLDLPYWEHLSAYDTNIHLAILSRFPFTERRPHKNDSFLLNGRRFHVSRGFAEVDIQVNPTYSFTLITTHLKSKRTSAEDEAAIRLEEAKLLRETIDARLAANPNLNLIVTGDLNDTKDSPSTRAVIGRYRNRLIDTCPAERNGDSESSPPPQKGPRKITWTHYYSEDDTYSRIDFLLLSRGMAREWRTNETNIPSIPGWGIGSDHRPLCAVFEARDR